MNTTIKNQIKTVIITATLAHTFLPTNALYAMEPQDEQKSNATESPFVVRCDQSSPVPVMMSCESNEPRTMAPRTAAADSAAAAAMPQAAVNRAAEPTPQLLTHEQIDIIFYRCSQAPTYDEKVEIIKQMIHTFGINATFKRRGYNSSRTPLVEAIQNNDTEIVKILIDLGVDINATDNHNRTPLWWASWNDNTDIAKMLIANKTDVNIADTYDNITALTNATSTKNIELCNILITNNADVNSAPYTNNTTLLIQASSLKNTEIANILIANSADVNAENRYQMTPLISAGNNTNLVATLILAGATYSHKQSDQFSAKIKTIILASQEAKKGLYKRNWLSEDFIATTTLPIARDQQEFALRHLIAEYAAPYHEIPEIQEAIIKEIKRRQNIKAAKARAVAQAEATAQLDTASTEEEETKEAAQSIPSIQQAHNPQPDPDLRD